MVRNIHAPCSAEDIMKDLQIKNFAIVEVSQIRSRKDEALLPLEKQTFEIKRNTKRIFEIKEILDIKVTTEALRRSNLLPQCKNCQAYGHTQKYCMKEARCVKCVGKHHTKECQKTRAKSPKFV
jgi:hypothetical protein